MTASRLLDVAASLVVLSALAVPMAIVGIAIKAVMGGPVFYRQRRIGRGGQPFWFYKFRTMNSSAQGAAITAAGDPRITPLGRALRRWKVDELPQFWNVLRGDMALVGPRPEAERFIQYYIPEHRRLLAKAPGIASMSQLVYPHEADMLRDCADPEQFYAQQLMPKKLAVDLEYERSRTMFSDLQLLFELTLFVLTGRSRRKDSSVSIEPMQKTAVN